MIHQQPTREAAAEAVEAYRDMRKELLWRYEGIVHTCGVQGCTTCNDNRMRVERMDRAVAALEEQLNGAATGTQQ